MRLPEELAAEAEAVARVKGTSVNALIIESLTAEIERVRADKDFDLLVMPGAGHGSAGSPYGQRRQQDFFVRHLLGVEPRRP